MWWDRIFETKIKNLENENDELKKGLYYIDERIENLIKDNNLKQYNNFYPFISEKPKVFYSKKSNY